MVNRITGLPGMVKPVTIPGIIASQTHKVRVDGINGSALTQGADGKVMPVKNFADAIAIGNALVAEYGGTVIVEASPMYNAYDEDIIFPGGFSLHNAGGSNSLKIKGDVTFSAGSPISVKGLNQTDKESVVNFNAPASLQDCYFAGKTVVNGVVVQAYNTHIVTEDTEALDIVGETAKYHALLATIRATGEFPAIKATGTFIGKLCNVIGGSPTAPTILSEVDGTVQIFDSLVQNPVLGASMDIRNNASISAPNVLHGVMAVGAAICGEAHTHVNDVSMKHGEITGTNLIFESNAHHKNDSEVPGATTALALNHLKTLVESAGGGLNWKGTWNAETNVPEILSGEGSNGDYYRVAVPGSTAIDGIDEWGENDWIIFSEPKGAWQKIKNSESVTSVNDQTGDVELKAEDIPFTPAEPANWVETPEQVKQALDELAGRSGAGLVPVTDTFALESGDIIAGEFGPLSKIPVSPKSHVNVSFEGWPDQVHGNGYSITMDNKIHIKGLSGLVFAGQNVMAQYLRVTE